MARINLLPWRAERRKKREREFYALLVGSALAGILVLALAIGWMGMRIDNQNARNAILTGEIKQLDKQIADIAKLDQTRAKLLSRQQTIEQLQSNRSQMVHLFDEMVKTIPDGTRLTSMKEVGDTLTLVGATESNARVANYMNRINASPWMGQSELEKIENKSGGKDTDQQLPYVFSLAVKLNKPAEAAETDADGNAGAAGTTPAQPPVPAAAPTPGAPTPAATPGAPSTIPPTTPPATPPSAAPPVQTSPPSKTSTASVARRRAAS